MFRCFLVLLILFLIGVAVLVLDEVTPIWWAKGKIATSAPGIGATREEVEAWLDRQGTGPNRYSGVKVSDMYPATESPSEFGNLLPGVWGPYLVGRISVPHLYGWASEVWIYFFFDSNGRRNRSRLEGDMRTARDRMPSTSGGWAWLYNRRKTRTQPNRRKKSGLGRTAEAVGDVVLSGERISLQVWPQ